MFSDMINLNLITRRTGKAMAELLNKKFVKSVLSFGLVFVGLMTSSIALADFRKALEAYQKRDGSAMLVEVKDAVDKKNDIGLMLYLSALDLDFTTSEHNPVVNEMNTTYNSILTQPQQEEMLSLLIDATSNSTADSQYFLMMRTPFRRQLGYRKYINPKQSQALSGSLSQEEIDAIHKLNGYDYSAILGKASAEYAEKGSNLAIFEMYIGSQRAENPKKLEPLQRHEYWLTKIAESGHPNAQLQLGLKYISYMGDYGCELLSKEPICQSKDESKSHYWLKRAVKSYEISAYADFSEYARTMSAYFTSTANGDKEKLRQAQLWDSMRKPSWSSAGSMQPDWVVEARKALAKENAPVFTYYFSDTTYAIFGDEKRYELALYADGQVKAGFSSRPVEGILPSNLDLLMKVSPKVMRSFFSDLKKIGFYDWLLIPTHPGFCDMYCPTTDMQITTRNGVNVHRIILGDWQLKDLDENDIAKSKMTEVRVAEVKKYIENTKKSELNMRMAKIKVLVEKYFPTKQLRCELGNSDKAKQACLKREKFWADIAKQAKPI